jgi:NitT/TauT family transport system permease protein
MACSGKGPDLTGFSGRAGRVLSLVSLLGLWWGAARLAGDPGRLPGPGAVARFAWHAFIAGEMVPAMLATLARVAAAFVLSMLAGAAIGMLAGRSRQADALIDPWLVIALNLPVLMVVVLVYIWMGLTEAAAIVSVCIAKIPTVVVTVREGARALDPALDELAQCFAIPRRRRWLKILLPQMAPYLAAAARAGLSVTWKIVLIVELIGRPNGVGFELNLFFQNFDVAGIVAYGLAFSLVMLAAETFLLQRLERRANAWR